MRGHQGRWIVLLAAGVVVASGDAPPSAGPVAATAVQSPAAALTGYLQVDQQFDDAAQSQSVGTVACPSGRVLVGGGVVVDDPDLSENLNSSYPNGNGWVGFVNNASTAPGTYSVYAVCVSTVAKRTVVVGSAVDNPAGSQTRASATCPKGTVVLGGGGLLSAASTSVNLSSSAPFNGGKGWRVDANNGSGGDDIAQAFAVCGAKPAKYAVKVGASTSVGTSAQGYDAVTCPAGTYALGGGGFSSSGSTTVDLNSTWPPTFSTWRAYVSDTSTINSTVTAYALCAKA